ncbi:MAG: lipid-A-disaccharide synthase [Thermoanaerobaculia bacterium]
MEKKKILIVAGEASGDLHGANLVRSLKKERNIDFFGIGGEKLRAQGVEILADIEKISVMGFFEVLFKIPYLYLIYKKILKKIKKEKTDLAILIDYPGFNFILMKKLYHLGVPVVYYICPQVWAWKKERVKLLKAYTKKRLVIFPFEEEFFKKEGVEAIYVGHPLLDIMEKIEHMEENKIKIGIFPGSRKGEIKRILPEMLKICQYLKENLEKVEFYIKIYKPLKDFIYKRLKKFPLDFKQIEEVTPLTFSLMTSGTVTLENGLYLNPGVVLYKLNPLTYHLLKNKVKTKYISITNILLNEMVYEEFLQEDARASKIKDFVLNLVQDKEKLKEKREKLSRIQEILKKGAVEKAKEEILKLI